MNILSSEISLQTKQASTLILGIGNLILSDDGVGIHVVRELKKKFSSNTDLEFAEISTCGLSLAERFIGYKKVILIDALALENGSPGRVHKLTMNDFNNTIHMYCAHDCNLATAYSILLQELGSEKLPVDVKIIGIEVGKFDEFSTTLSKKVQKALPKAVALVIEELMLEL